MDDNARKTIQEVCKQFPGIFDQKIEHETARMFLEQVGFGEKITEYEVRGQWRNKELEFEQILDAKKRENDRKESELRRFQECAESNAKEGKRLSSSISASIAIGEEEDRDQKNQALWGLMGDLMHGAGRWALKKLL